MLYIAGSGVSPELFNILSAAVAVGAAWFLIRRRRRVAPELPGNPILMSYYTDGKHLGSIKAGLFGDLHYSAMITTNILTPDGTPQSALLYRVELPFTTTVHLLAIPRETGAVRLDPTQGKGIMEPVDLEGDFSKYFDLFCEKGMQQDARYVLDPKAMVFVLDFCQSQNWEIVGNQLYFVIASGMKQDPSDTTNLQEDIPRFVAEIRPALQRPLTEKQQATLNPYGADRRNNLRCPICKKVMTNEQGFFRCPDGDGILLNGAALQQIKQGQLTIALGKSRKPHRPASLTCPSCGKPMTHVAYDGGPTTIDSCTNCPYRWLDAGEAAALTVR